MKFILLICLLTLSISCKQDRKAQHDKKQDPNVTNHGLQLYESGFLKFADSLKLDSLKLALINSFDIYNEDNNRIAHVDAEELAEFSFDFFLPNLNRILKARGIILNIRTSEDYEKTNELWINGEKIQLYTKQELDNNEFWESSSKHFFKEVNRQLSKSGLNESFYLLYGGNDLHVLLLTESQYTIIADKYKGDPKEIPYLP